MIATKPERPYLAAWLRRTGRQFTTSGRLTQTAMALSHSEGGSVEHWRFQLRQFLEGADSPSLDLLTKIDLLLAGASKQTIPAAVQGEFF